MSDQTAKVRERFERETAEHQLTVLRDDGLYRHLRGQQPGTWTYGFDIVTWPGYLAVVGDAGDFVFSRLRDMFEFFDADRGRINPQYWAEKLQAPRPAGAEQFSVDAYRARVLRWLREQEADILPSARSYDDSAERTGHAPPREVLAYLDELEYDYDESHIQAVLDLRDAVDEQLLASWLLPTNEHSAYDLLAQFEHDGRRIDGWEWSMREHDWQFLWCCHAIVWAIARYRAHAPAPEAQAA